ncbi:MAG: GNAT family N-acetyltransferase [Bacteroidota bacterium]
MTAEKFDPFQVVSVHEEREFEHCFEIRAEVFQEELGITEEEDLDGHDHIAHHFLIVSGHRLVGTGRWRITLGGKAKIERIAVLEVWRGKGAARVLVETMLKYMPKDRELYVEAYAEIVGFWEKMGFEADGEVYEVAGIEHQRMVYVVLMNEHNRNT